MSSHIVGMYPSPGPYGISYLKGRIEIEERDLVVDSSDEKLILELCRKYFSDFDLDDRCRFLRWRYILLSSFEDTHGDVDRSDDGVTLTASNLWLSCGV